MAKRKKRIGVVIPSYKMGLSLRWTLDSIAAQRRMPDEVCVVFDGEDPIGEKLAREHVAVTEVIVRKECSGGAAQPRNDGWKRIGGRVDYIHFLDSDDLVSPWFYERLSSALDDDPAIAGVKVGCFSVSDKEIENDLGFSKWDQLNEIRFDQIEVVRLENCAVTWPPFSFSLLRSDSVAALEIEGEPWRGRRSGSSSGRQEFMEDSDFAFRLLAAGRYCTVGGIGGVYVLRDGSISGSMGKAYLWVWKAYEMAIVPWADQQEDVQVRRLARKMRSMSVRKYARSEKSFRLAMTALSRDLLRRPRLKTIVAIALFLLGLDPQRRKYLSQPHSHRKLSDRDGKNATEAS